MKSNEELVAEYRASEERESEAMAIVAAERKIQRDLCHEMWGISTTGKWVVKNDQGVLGVVDCINSPDLRSGRPSLQVFKLKKDGTPSNRSTWFGYKWEVVGPFEVNKQ